MDSFAASPDSDRSIPGSTIATPTHQFNTGDTVIGRYTVLEHLGKGGMGVVYKCFDKISGVEVALKTIAPELSGSLWEMEGIKKNFQLVHNLHHDNIASYNTLEQDKDSGIYYLVMEYVYGEDLRYYLRNLREKGGFSEKVVIKIVHEIADALDYAHSKKILHRDIKPANIMIDRKGHVKLLDFGLAAQIHSSLSKVSMQKIDTSGTLPYISPEQWRGKRTTAASDQYSLAATVYEIFSGEVPFSSPNTEIMRCCVLHEEPELLEDVSENIQSAVAKALSKTPEERFENCQAFAAALGSKILSAEPVKVIDPPPRASEELNPQERTDFYLLREKIAPLLKDFQKLYPEMENLPGKVQDAIKGVEAALNGDCCKSNYAVLQTADEIFGAYYNLESNRDKVLELTAELNEFIVKIPEDIKQKQHAAEQAVKAGDITVAGALFEQVKATLQTLCQNEKMRRQKEAEQSFIAAEGKGVKFSKDRRVLERVPAKITGEFQIPEGVTSIGECAFEECSSLTSVVIPDSVTSIGECAFWKCSSLTSIEIPNSVTSIGERAFRECSSLTSIEIPNSVTSIRKWSFWKCSSLTSVVIPDSVTSIGERAFEECSSLTSIEIPNSVTSIEEGAFSGCSSLTSVVIPNSVTSIGKSAFRECSSLTSIVIPDGVTSIEKNAFGCCFNLNSVKIPNSVTSIGEDAFWGCSSLSSLEIPDSVTNIGDRAFGHSNLTNIVIPKSVKSMGRDVFTGVMTPGKTIVFTTIAAIVTGLLGLIIGDGSVLGGVIGAVIGAGYVLWCRLDASKR